MNQILTLSAKYEIFRLCLRNNISYFLTGRPHWRPENPTGSPRRRRGEGQLLPDRTRRFPQNRGLHRRSRQRFQRRGQERALASRDARRHCSRGHSARASSLGYSARPRSNTSLSLRAGSGATGHRPPRPL